MGSCWQSNKNKKSNCSTETQQSLPVLTPCSNFSLDQWIKLLIDGYVRAKLVYQELEIPDDIVNTLIPFLEPSETDFFNNYNNKNAQFHHIGGELNMNQKLKDISKWDRYTNSGGAIQIFSTKRIIISKNGGINLDKAGYSEEWGRGKGGRELNDFAGGGSHAVSGKGVRTAKGGKVYGDKTLNTLSYGSPSGFGYGGGGIIELIAETIINHGIITCLGIDGGSGGSIKITAKTFENYGWINAEGGKGFSNYIIIGDGGCGYIAIYCETFKNKGTISPEPYIEKKDYKPLSFTNIHNYFQ
eukprot:312605_1